MSTVRGTLRRHFLYALVMSSFSFLLGFATSRYLIDATLRQADALLLRSAQESEREQTALMRQFRIDYGAVETKLAPIRPGKANR